MNNIEILINLIKNSKKTVFFGGAGVSTPSGLKDFRSKNGLYNEKYPYPPESILSHSFFESNPKEFYIFYKDKLNSLKYKPNIVHKTLSLMENKNILSCIITQNIDGFHQIAGSNNVLELHGSIMRNYCAKCHKFYEAEYIFNSIDIPTCNCGGIIKPDVILYEENLDTNTLNTAINEIKQADLLIIGGTSLNVYPAAGLINYKTCKNIVLINKDNTPYNNYCSLVINDNIENVFTLINNSLTDKDKLSYK